MRRLRAILCRSTGSTIPWRDGCRCLDGTISSGSFVINFNQFTTFSWAIFAVELVGMAVFMFGISAALSRTDLKNTSKAVVIGMSLKHLLGG